MDGDWLQLDVRQKDRFSKDRSGIDAFTENEQMGCILRVPLAVDFVCGELIDENLVEARNQ